MFCYTKGEAEQHDPCTGILLNWFWSAKVNKLRFTLIKSEKFGLEYTFQT